MQLRLQSFMAELFGCYKIKKKEQKTCIYNAAAAGDGDGDGAAPGDPAPTNN